jgi:hypothetical protein
LSAGSTEALLSGRRGQRTSGHFVQSDAAQQAKFFVSKIDPSLASFSVIVLHDVTVPTDARK